MAAVWRVRSPEAAMSLQLKMFSYPYVKIRPLHSSARAAPSARTPPEKSPSYIAAPAAAFLRSPVQVLDGSPLGPRSPLRRSSFSLVLVFFRIQSLRAISVNNFHVGFFSTSCTFKPRLETRLCRKSSKRIFQGIAVGRTSSMYPVLVLPIS